MAARQTFENAMSKLETIVQQLESEDLPLESAIKKFEEGIKLSQFCTQKLDQSEKRVNLLLKQSDGLVVEKKFEVDDNND